MQRDPGRADDAGDLIKNNLDVGKESAVVQELVDHMLSREAMGTVMESNAKSLLAAEETPITVDKQHGWVRLAGSVTPLGRVRAWASNVTCQCNLHPGCSVIKPLTFFKMDIEDARQCFARWLRAGMDVEKSRRAKDQHRELFQVLFDK